nr:uncharacterized protein LOC127486604 isoform X2 [Oryctolagus cuniculus]
MQMRPRPVAMAPGPQPRGRKNWRSRRAPRPRAPRAEPRAGHPGAPQRALAGEDDLQLVRVLEMCVDTRESSLGNFGVHLPSLNQLKLNGSRLGSLRVRVEMVPGPRRLRAAGDPREDGVRGPAHRAREPPGWSSGRQNHSLQSILVNVRCSHPRRTKLQWVWWILSWVLLGLGGNRVGIPHLSAPSQFPGEKTQVFREQPPCAFSWLC